MPRTLDGDAVAASLRARAVNLDSRKLLVSYFPGSAQERDLQEPPNCDGVGRIRHFQRRTASRWVPNPLPIDPAILALGMTKIDNLRAQVFQNAFCNWRCWYCFVPFNLLNAVPKRSRWLSAEELVDLYLGEQEPAPIIDLTGGQPDLVPEWVVWTMDALMKRGAAERVFLWSDDNLSNDYFWRYLSESERESVASFPRYAKVCCFKGFDALSFSFNTSANETLFERQMDLARRLLTTGIDLYFYVTFTTPSVTRIDEKMKVFLDRLQGIHPLLPLRTVPLEIKEFTPVSGRMKAVHREALTRHQWVAVEAWLREVEQRFSSEQRETLITRIDLGRRRAGP